MKSTSTARIATLALAFAGALITTARADGLALPQVTISTTGTTATVSTNATAPSTTQAVTTATTTVASALSSATNLANTVSQAVSQTASTAGTTAKSSSSSLSSMASGALSSVLGSTAAPTTAAPATALPAAPKFSLASANDYATKFTKLCGDALTAYQTKDLMKAASLMPQVTEAYNQGTAIASSLTGGESKQFTDWKSSLMNAVTTAASSLTK